MKVDLVCDSISFCGDRLSTFELELPTVDLPALFSYRMLSVSVRPSPFLGQLYIDWVTKHPRVAVPADVVELATRLGPDLLLPWSFTHVLVSATEWGPFLKHFPNRELAQAVGALLEQRKPKLLSDSEWHLPYVNRDDASSPDFVPEAERGRELQICVDRCARRAGAHDELSMERAFSFFEHAAQSLGRSLRVGNFLGWKQYRKFFKDEWGGERSIEYNPATDNGWQPRYVRMEDAFRQLLLGAMSKEANGAAAHLFASFFPDEVEWVVTPAPPETPVADVETEP